MTEISNLQRATWADIALQAFSRATGMEWENDQTRLTDLLADLMHFCAVHAKREDCPMDFSDALRVARSHFHEEKSLD